METIIYISLFSVLVGVAQPQRIDTNVKYSGLYNTIQSIKASEVFGMVGIAKQLQSGFANIHGNLTRACYLEFNTLLKPLRSNTTKELIRQLAVSQIGKYIDSWGKPPSQIFLGNIQWLGGYHECNEISNAKYCLSKMHGNAQYSPVNYGSCIPRDCTYEDNLVILNVIGQSRSISFRTYSGMTCEQPRKYKIGFFATLGVCVVILLLSFLGTVVDVVTKRTNQSSVRNEIYVLSNLQADTTAKHNINEKNIATREISINGNNNINKNDKRSKSVELLKKLLLCFSILRNNKAFLSTTSPAGAIESINGIRTISMMWIILGHSYVFLQYFPLNNLQTTLLNIHDFSFLVASNAYVGVDTFFLLSGLLVAYLALKRMDKTGKLNIPMYYLHRLVRLIPPYMLVLSFYNNIFPMLVRGPTSQTYRNDEFHQKCNEYWWTNLLFINNFSPNEKVKQCMGWCWYLANDMQFYILSPIFLYTVHYLDQKYKETRFQHYGPFIVTLIGCVSYITINAVLIAVNDYPVLVTGHFLSDNPRRERTIDAQDNIYIKPWGRYAPYVVGLYLGYILLRKIHFPPQHKKWLALVCWIVSVAMACGVVFGPYTVFRKGGNYFKMHETIMYGSMHRLAFSVSVAWVIYACQHNYAGLINNFLSWRVFIPLSRLTFGVYLLHPMVFMYLFVAFEDTVHYQNNLWAYYFVAVTCLSHACAYILALFVEYPVRNIESIIFKA